MKPFMDEDFLLSNETAKTLYHNYAKQVPIIDYHCHLNPKEIYEAIKAHGMKAAELEEAADIITGYENRNILKADQAQREAMITDPDKDGDKVLMLMRNRARAMKAAEKAGEIIEALKKQKALAFFHCLGYYVLALRRNEC